MTVSENAVTLGVAALPPLLSLTEAARLCSVSKRLMDEWCLTGRVVSLKIGGKRLIPKQELFAWIERETARAKAEIAAGARTDLRFRQVAG